jgi:transcriptional regulator with XRE-family HTH domain
MVTVAAEMTAGFELQRTMSQLVRMLMARDGLNQQQLGERIGLDQTTVSARLRSMSRWTVEDLTRLSITFGIHPGEFWTDPKDFTPGIHPVAARRRKPVRIRPKSSGWLTARAAA